MSNDDHVLRLLAAGELRVDPQTGRVWVLHPARFLGHPARWVEKKISYCPQKDRYRFHFQFAGRKTTVPRSRLLHLAATRRKAEVVDHTDGNRTNDAINNLGVHTRRESNRQGREAQRAAVAANAKAFFDYIAFWGEEPPDHRRVPSVSHPRHEANGQDHHHGDGHDPEHLSDPRRDADPELGEGDVHQRHHGGDDDDNDGNFNQGVAAKDGGDGK